MPHPLAWVTKCYTDENTPIKGDTDINLCDTGNILSSFYNVAEKLNPFWLRICWCLRRKKVYGNGLGLMEMVLNYKWLGVSKVPFFESLRLACCGQDFDLNITK